MLSPTYFPSGSTPCSSEMISQNYEQNDRFTTQPFENNTKEPIKKTSLNRCRLVERSESNPRFGPATKGGRGRVRLGYTSAAITPVMQHTPNRQAMRGNRLFSQNTQNLHNDTSCNYLGTDLVTALTSLQVNNFAHSAELFDSK